MTDLLKPVNSNKPLTATQEKQIRVLGLVSEYYNVYQKLEQVLKRGFVDALPYATPALGSSPVVG